MISRTETAGNQQGTSLRALMVEIDEDRAGQRLDNFLLSQLKGVPKTRVYRMVRSGEVRVNKGRKQVSYRLAEGDVVRIPPVRQSEVAEVQLPSQQIDARQLGLIRGLAFTGRKQAGGIGRAWRQWFKSWVD